MADINPLTRRPKGQAKKEIKIRKVCVVPYRYINKESLHVVTRVLYVLVGTELTDACRTSFSQVILSNDIPVPRLIVGLNVVKDRDKSTNTRVN